MTAPTMWRVRDGYIHKAYKDCHDETCRPVLVIDPEDEDQARRFVDELVAAESWIGDGERTVGVQAAFRAMLTPRKPKPDEPKGLGAVVVDRDDQAWIRVSTSVRLNDIAWAKVGNVGVVSGWRSWSDIAAVDVKNPGVDR